MFISHNNHLVPFMNITNTIVINKHTVITDNYLTFDAPDFNSWRIMLLSD
jgi:hypothetical protein